MKFSIKGLKGYVTARDGVITCHGPENAKYMKKLVEKAQLWVDAWTETAKPDIEFLSPMARQIVEQVETDGFAYQNFCERVADNITSGTHDRERAIELWVNWLNYQIEVKNFSKNAIREAATHLYEEQMFDILKGD